MTSSASAINGHEKALHALVAYNATRRAQSDALRGRIAHIVACYRDGHGGEWPTARQVRRALKPAIKSKPPLSLRAVQWHLHALRVRIDTETL